jgi:hypothetical protein
VVETETSWMDPPLLQLLEGGVSIRAADIPDEMLEVSRVLMIFLIFQR